MRSGNEAHRSEDRAMNPGRRGWEANRRRLSSVIANAAETGSLVDLTGSEELLRMKRVERVGLGPLGLRSLRAVVRKVVGDGRTVGRRKIEVEGSVEVKVSVVDADTDVGGSLRRRAVLATRFPEAVVEGEAGAGPRTGQLPLKIADLQLQVPGLSIGRLPEVGEVSILLGHPAFVVLLDLGDFLGELLLPLLLGLVHLLDALLLHRLGSAFVLPKLGLGGLGLLRDGRKLLLGFVVQPLPDVRIRSRPETDPMNIFKFVNTSALCSINAAPRKLDLIVPVKLKKQTWADSDFRFCENNPSDLNLRHISPKFRPK